MSTINDELTLARNSLTYVKSVFDKAEFKERLAKEEALKALKEELRSYNAVIESKNHIEMLPLVKVYGDAVRNNTIATAILSEAYHELVAKQKALDIATTRLSQLQTIHTTKYHEL